MIEFSESEVVIVDCLKIVGTQFCISQRGIGKVLAVPYPEGKTPPPPLRATADHCGSLYGWLRYWPGAAALRGRPGAPGTEYPVLPGPVFVGLCRVLLRPPRPYRR